MNASQMLAGMLTGFAINVAHAECKLLGSEPDRQACGLPAEVRLIDRCENRISPSRNVFVYEPDVVSETQVKTRMVRCMDGSCRTESGIAYYIRSPNEYFTIDNEQLIEESLLAASLYQSETFRPSWNSDLLGALSSWSLKHVVLSEQGVLFRASNCGCDAEFPSKIHRLDGSYYLTIEKTAVVFQCY